MSSDSAGVRLYTVSTLFDLRVQLSQRPRKLLAQSFIAMRQKSMSGLELFDSLRLGDESLLEVFAYRAAIDETQRKEVTEERRDRESAREVMHGRTVRRGLRACRNVRDAGMHVLHPPKS